MFYYDDIIPIMLEMEDNKHIQIQTFVCLAVSSCTTFLVYSIVIVLTLV